MLAKKMWKIKKEKFGVCCWLAGWQVCGWLAGWQVCGWFSKCLLCPLFYSK
jgi:hypothetical protein